MKLLGPRVVAKMECLVGQILFNDRGVLGGQIAPSNRPLEPPAAHNLLKGAQNHGPLAFQVMGSIKTTKLRVVETQEHPDCQEDAEHFGAVGRRAPVRLQIRTKGREPDYPRVLRVNIVARTADPKQLTFELLLEPLIKENAVSYGCSSQQATMIWATFGSESPK